MSQPTTPEPTGSCLIIDTAVYEEARDVHALHTRYQVTLSTQELSRLHAHLGAYLEQRPAA